jgi:putative CRISPR-associated protein (TIGR02619 family)
METVKMKPHVLISTVGTSLLTNLCKLDEKTEPEARRLVEDKNWAQVARWLRSQPPGGRTCGAEINTIHDLTRSAGEVAGDATLHFCVSETDGGKAMGSILKSYYEGKGQRCEVHEIGGLQDNDVDRFRTHGLRRLVQVIGRIVREAGGPEYAAINATGGYKAQIALASVIGQTMGVTVYYKHESFLSTIAMPPMPVSFDYSLLGLEADLLDALESGDTVEAKERPLDPRLEPLVELITIDGKQYVELTALGQVYLDGWRLRHPPEKTLPQAAIDRKQPRFAGDHHRQQGFEEYVEKVWRETPYITGGITADYGGQRGIRDRSFRVQNDEVVAEYRDPSGFGGRFIFHTTAVNAIQRAAVADDLNRRYGRG